MCCNKTFLGIARKVSPVGQHSEADPNIHRPCQIGTKSGWKYRFVLIPKWQAIKSGQCWWRSGCLARRKKNWQRLGRFRTHQSSGQWWWPTNHSLNSNQEVCSSVKLSSASCWCIRSNGCRQIRLDIEVFAATISIYMNKRPVGTCLICPFLNFVILSKK